MTAVVLLIFGLYKKMVIGDGVGGLINQNLEMGIDGMGPFDAGATMLGFSAQIYCDFSGYSDMALGFAILLGIHIPANFNYPYRARSVTEFWHRWHISLSTWFRDYLYIPLGGNRRGLAANCVVVMLVFCLSGLWHGAAWNFVTWGAIHGLLLIAHRLIRRTGVRFPSPVGWIVTFCSVTLAWSFFFLDCPDALKLISSLWSFDAEPLKYNNGFILVYVGMVIGDFILKPYRVVDGKVEATRIGVALCPVAIVSMFYFAGKPLPFIYFDF